jgi:hypothetical protein
VNSTVQPTITAARSVLPALVFALAMIAEGAYVERILVDANLLESFELVADHDGKLDLIMKDANIGNNTI